MLPKVRTITSWSSTRPATLSKAVVPQIASGNGIAFSGSYVFASEADSGAVAVIDKPTWKVIATVPSGGKTPDAIYYDPQEKQRLCLQRRLEQHAAVLRDCSLCHPRDAEPDPAQAKTGPDLGTYVSANDTIYQSDDNRIDVIDAKTRTIQRSLHSSERRCRNEGYLLRPRRITCSGWGTSDPKVLAIDPDTGKVVYTVKTASGMDQLSADTDDGLLFLGESKAGVMGVVDLLPTKTSLTSNGIGIPYRGLSAQRSPRVHLPEPVKQDSDRQRQPALTAALSAFDDDLWGSQRRQFRMDPVQRSVKDNLDKLHELQRLWLIEAVKYNVLPLDYRQIDASSPIRRDGPP